MSSKDRRLEDAGDKGKVGFPSTTVKPLKIIGAVADDNTGQA